MGSLLSSNIPFSSGFSPGSLENQTTIQVPYTVWIRVFPKLGTGKRFTYIRDLEKLAQIAEEFLSESTSFGDLNIARPVAGTVQFGDNFARLTIVGFNEVSRSNAAPTTNIKQIHSGTDQGERTALISGSAGGSLSAGQDTTATIDAEVKTLRDDIYTRLSGKLPGFVKRDIIAIEYNGVKYGVRKQGGRSFPL